MKFLILAGALLAASIISQAQASDWSIAAELKEPSSIAIGFQESTAVSRDGKTVLVAANAESCLAGNACGAIYVYVKESSGWRRQAKLVASDAVAGLVLGGEGYDDNAIALSLVMETPLLLALILDFQVLVRFIFSSGKESYGSNNKN